MRFSARLNPRRLLGLCAATALLSLSWSGLAWAGDPFRGNNNPANISDRTEAAFEAMFKHGNYREAQQLIKQAAAANDPDPLVPALQAALAYNLDGNLQVDDYAARTQQAAQALIDRPNASAQDQVRGNIYLAAAVFMDAAADLKTNNDYVAAALRVQEIFRYLRRAERIDAEAGLNDPELNLVKGYIELLLAVNLPLSNPDNAIANLKEYAKPEYLVDRGIAIAYRDLGLKSENTADASTNYEEALSYVDAVLAIAPNNPEIKYLKAQILHEWGKLSGQENREMLQEAIDLFDEALEDVDQLPSELEPQIEREQDIAEEALANLP